MKRVGLTFALIILALPAFARERVARPDTTRHRVVVIARQISNDAGAAWLAFERVRDRFEQLMYRINDPSWLLDRSR